MHNFHLVIIINKGNLLDTTLSSISKYFPKFRSLTLVKNNKIKLNEKHISYDIINIKQNIKRNLDKFFLETIKKLKIHKKLKIFFLFEGEFIIGEDIIDFWNKDENNILLKVIDHNHKSIWNLRIVNLTENVNILTDKNHYPCIQTTSTKLFKIEKKIFITNSPFKTLTYKSCQLLEKGYEYLNKNNLKLAIFHFNSMKMKKNISYEIKSRCIFSIGYMMGLNGIILDKIIHIMEKSYLISNCKILEPFYFLLQLAIKEKKYYKVIDLIESKYKSSILIYKQPKSFILSYKKPIYDYLYLYLLVICAYKSNRYIFLLEIIEILLNKDDIPNFIKSECILILDEVTLKLEYKQFITNNFNTSQNIAENIKLIFKRPKVINVLLTNKKYSKTTLSNNIGNKHFISNGNKFLLVKDRPKTYLDIIYHNKYIANIKYYKNDIQVLDFPYLFIEKTISVNDYTNNFVPKQYLIGKIILDTSNTNNFKEYSLLQLSSPKHRLTKFTILIGTSKYEDYFNILLCFLNGNYVFYKGSREIFLDISSIFSNYIYDISNFTIEDTQNKINSLKSKDIDFRHLVIEANKYLLFNILNKNILNPTHNYNYSRLAFNLFISNQVNILDNFNDITKLKNNKLIEQIKEILKTNPNHFIIILNKGYLDYFTINKINFILKNIHIYHELITIDFNQLHNKYFNIKYILESSYLKFSNKIQILENKDIIIVKNIDILYKLKYYISNNIEIKKIYTLDC